MYTTVAIHGKKKENANGEAMLKRSGEGGARGAGARTAGPPRGEYEGGALQPRAARGAYGRNTGEQCRIHKMRV